MTDQTDELCQRKLPQRPIPRRAFHYEDDSPLPASAQSETRRAVEETSQEFQSTYSSRHLLTDGQDGSSLVSYTEANNTLPVDWNFFKRGRLSEGDITDLQERLILDHNLRQTEPRRPAELDPSTIIGGDLQRQYDGASNFAILDKTLRSLTFFPNSWQWTQKTTRTLSVYTTSCQERIVNQLSGCPLWLSDSALVISKGTFRLLHDCTMITGQVWSWGWSIVRWLLLILVMFLIALNAIAIAYTVTHEAFLDSLCVKELSLVRDWMCSAWDDRLQSGKGGVEWTGTFPDPLATILNRNSSVISYKLPHILARYENMMRSFRVNLPVSQYSATDQVYLRKLFTEFIDQSDKTINNSQDFHIHIMGTISRSIDNTRYHVEKISENNLTSLPLNEGTFELTYETDDALSKSMAWSKSHYMVWLPAGLEPFRQRAIRIPLTESVIGLQKHIAHMAERLVVGLDMAVALRSHMRNQRDIATKIEEHVAISRSENNVKLAQRSNWRHLGEQLLSKSQPTYQVEQRVQWLEVMATAFDQYDLFLNGTIIDMDTARVQCNELSDRLLEEVERVTSGWMMSDWVKNETRVLKKRVDNLEDLSKSFNLEWGAFRAAPFRQVVWIEYTRFAFTIAMIGL